ncbi:hypothetical protein CC_0739 [Caulobacter vibrioides CB15]|uniref:Uncharacterized protein n=1 Tax=Caulobacter vibrioides (strain ATCC 19089 / CIP 103742 / CB 15) TaxID=190650 RepID=Q9AA67_CAUVC|nr:hypothetical protein CC_0739 [Caulobacter vibrioides CB15]
MKKGAAEAAPFVILLESLALEAVLQAHAHRPQAGGLVDRRGGQGGRRGRGVAVAIGRAGRVRRTGGRAVGAGALGVDHHAARTAVGVLLHHTPLLVEQVAQVLDVHREQQAVATDRGGDLLGVLEVDAIHARVLAEATRHDLAHRQAELVDQGLEAVDRELAVEEHRRARRADELQRVGRVRAVQVRDIGQGVVARHAEGRVATAGRIGHQEADRTTVATLAEQGEARHPARTRLELVAEVHLQRVAQQVVRLALGGAVRIQVKALVGIVVAARGVAAGGGAELRDAAVLATVLPGVGGPGVDAEDVAAGRQGDRPGPVLGRGVIGLDVAEQAQVGQVGVGDDRQAQGRAAGVDRRGVGARDHQTIVTGATVGRQLLDAVDRQATSAGVAEGHIDLRPAGHRVDAPVDAELGGLEREVGLPVGRHLEAGGQRVGVGVATAGAVGGQQGLGDGRRVGDERGRGLVDRQEGVAGRRVDGLVGGGVDEGVVGRRERAVGGAADREAVGQGAGGAAIAVAQEHVRQTARHQAKAARQLEPVAVVLGRDARHHHVDAVIGGLVGIAVAVDEVGVQRRLLVGGVVIPADPEVHGQGVGDVPGVLGQQRVDLVVQHRGGVGRRAGQRVAVRQLVGLAGLELGDAVEVVDPARGLQEQVVDLHPAILVAELDLVVVEAGIVGDERARGVLGLQDVGLTELVRAEVDRRHARRAREGRAGAEGRVGADRDVGEALAHGRQLAALIAAERHARFGRQIRAPARVQLQGVVVLVLRLDVPVGVQADGVGRGAALPDRAEGVAIGGREAVLVGDVVVDLDRRLLVEDRLDQGHRARLQQRRGRIAVPVGQHRVDVGLAGAGSGRDARNAVEGVGEARADRADARGVGAGELLVGGREEQAVLDDRTRQEDAVVGLGDLVLDLPEAAQRRLEHVVVGEADDRQLVADQTGGALVGEQRAVEVVPARAHDQVQRAAGEVAVLDVEGHGLDRDLLEGLERDRAAVGRQAAGVQAVAVGRAHAVDGDAVGAGRRAGDVETARRTGAAGHEVQIGQRVAAADVTDVALDRHDGVDLVAAQGRARADIGQLAGRRLLRGGDDDFRQFGGGHQGQADALGVADVQEQVAEGLRGEALTRGGDLVGAADAQTARVEGAGLVGHDHLVGAAGHVGDGDGGAGDRRALVIDGDAAHRGRGLLGVNRRRCECKGQRAERRSGGELASERHGNPLRSAVPESRDACLAPTAPSMQFVTLLMTVSKQTWL